MFFRLSIFLLLLCDQVPYCLAFRVPWCEVLHPAYFPVPSFLTTGTPQAWIKSGEVFLSPSSHKGRLGSFSKEAGGLFYRGSLPTAVPLLLLFTLLPGCSSALAGHGDSIHLSFIYYLHMSYPELGTGDMGIHF